MTTITDTCPCGANFKVIAPADDAGWRHTSWLIAHALCHAREMEKHAPTDAQ